MSSDDGGRPMLRVVEDGEVPVPAPGQSPWRRAVVIAVAVGVVAAAVLVGVAVGHSGSNGPSASASRRTSTTAPGPGPTSTVDLSALPTVAPASTVTEPATPSTVAAPDAAGQAPTLVPLPVDGSTGGVAPPPVAPPTTAAPTTGSVRIRLFNGFTPGQSLEVWEVSSTPVRYGTLPYGGYAQIDAHGALLNSGVTLRLRFVLPGGDPVGEKSSPQSGPWSWNLVPAAGSAQTLVLVDNAGLRVVRIDDRRAEGAVRPGTVHVVPIARHLVLAGSRTMRWGHVPGGCIGRSTTDNTEFDVPVGTGLELFAGADDDCATPLTGPVTLTRSTAVAVIGLESGPSSANLVTLPLG